MQKDKNEYLLSYNVTSCDACTDKARSYLNTSKNDNITETRYIHYRDKFHDQKCGDMICSLRKINHKNRSKCNT